MRILISGGGIAGLTLAYWLKQYGLTPVVIEQAKSMRRAGYGIDFFGTGYDVAQRMGLVERLTAHKIPVQGISYVNEEGETTARLDIRLMEKVMYGDYIAMMHWTLEDALYDAVKEAVEIRFDCTLQAVEQDESAVHVTFDDGTQETFDLLIGADGIHSNTRDLVFGPESQFGHYMGYYVASYTLPDRYGIGKTWQNYVQPTRQVGVYCSGNPDEVIPFFMYETPDEGYIPAHERLPRLKQVFAGMGWITPRLLNDVPESEHIFMDTVTQIRMPSWNKGRVALVGDAAYCLTLISGQGSSMAMGGAYLLAQALRDCADYRTAFETYEAQLRPEIESRQKSANNLAKAFVPGSPLALFLQKLVLKVVFRDAFTGLLRRQFGAKSILKTAS